MAKRQCLESSNLEWIHWPITVWCSLKLLCAKYFHTQLHHVPHGMTQLLIPPATTTRVCRSAKRSPSDSWFHRRDRANAADAGTSVNSLRSHYEQRTKFHSIRLRRSGRNFREHVSAYMNPLNASRYQDGNKKKVFRNTTCLRAV